jgi:hypothetical protein
MPRSAGSCELDLCNAFEADIRLKVNYVSLTTSVPCPAPINENRIMVQTL